MDPLSFLRGIDSESGSGSSADFQDVAQMRVDDVMNPAPYYLDEGCSLGAAYTLLVRQGLRGAPVVDRSGKLLGLISVQQLLEMLGALLERGDASGLRGRPVGELVKRPARTVASDTPLHEACRLLSSDPTSPLLVVDVEGRPVGVLSAADVVQAISRLRDPARLEPVVTSG